MARPPWSETRWTSARLGNDSRERPAFRPATLHQETRAAWDAHLERCTVCRADEIPAVGVPAQRCAAGALLERAYYDARAAAADAAETNTYDARAFAAR